MFRLRIRAATRLVAAWTASAVAVYAQNPPNPPSGEAPAATAAAPQRPSLLEVRIVEGESVIYPVGSRATRGITIEVTDETGRPVEGAQVTFELPGDGPSGTFSGGGLQEVATTPANGRAEAWGMQWNRDEGPVEVRITATKGAVRAGAVATQYLTAALEPVAAAAGSGKRRAGSGKKWWIVVAIAGAAGAALAASRGSPSAQPSAAAVNAPQIGAPTITIGQPELSAGSVR